jgi:hypothetical protein
MLKGSGKLGETPIQTSGCDVDDKENGRRLILKSSFLRAHIVVVGGRLTAETRVIL